MAVDRTAPIGSSTPTGLGQPPADEDGARCSSSDIELMAQIQVLNFKPTSRLEPVCESVQATMKAVAHEGAPTPAHHAAIIGMRQVPKQ
jgi:hypothetical protein